MVYNGQIKLTPGYLTRKAPIGLSESEQGDRLTQKPSIVKQVTLAEIQRG